MTQCPEGYRGRLLYEVDCTQPYDAADYFESYPTTVTETPAGRYREAEARPLARFGYRFYIEHIGRPHMLQVRYPDDRRRYMCINDGTCYDLTTGVFTGVAYPLSGQMQALDNIFWPRWRDCSVVFMTWGEGEPAAVQSFAVWELEELPEAALPSVRPDGRQFGIQYEDPCGRGASEGAKSFSEWLSRTADYMRHTGQNLLVYPINWYHGPQFPSRTQPSDAFDVVVAEDRRQYSRSTTHPSDWPAVLLERFDREGLSFVGSITLLRLGRLMEGMNIDLPGILAGADTYNNMLYNNRVQSSCGDWTTVYNARNYREYTRRQQAGESLSDFPWVYGERRGDFHGGPMFNPLHPEVRWQLLEYFTEIGERYGRFRSFQGVSVNMWHATILWYGSIHSGYDDFTVSLFEKETGIVTGIAADDPERFSKRYEYLTFRCRPAWVEWRCRRLSDLVSDLRDAQQRGRKDLTLGLCFWNETSKAQIYGMPGPAAQYGSRLGDYEFFREAGADLRLLGALRDVSISVETNQARDRGWDTEGVNAPFVRGFMFRDHDFLDSAVHGALREALSPAGFVFNCWVEAWGEHRWFDCEQGDPNLPEIKKMYQGEAEYVHRMNSYYPKDGFWWDSQLRITSAFPAAPHFLEPFTHALAEYDALSITRGGLYMDKAHSRETARFAAAYRALPARRFETVGMTDPVAVRRYAEGDMLYFYAVNREPYPVRVCLSFTTDGFMLTELSDAAALSCGRELTLTLRPYELMSFSAPASAGLAGFTAAIPSEMETQLREQTARQLETFRRAEELGCSIPGADRMAREMERALEEGRYARLRRMLGSYIAQAAERVE